MVQPASPLACVPVRGPSLDPPVQCSPARQTTASMVETVLLVWAQTLYAGDLPEGGVVDEGSWT